MKYRPGIFKIILAVILVNTAGFILRYFNLDTYIIIIGFRFHLSLILPFFIVFKEDYLKEIKQLFVNPEYNKTLSPLTWIAAPLVIIGIIFYLFKILKLGDPEYFYELGLSSIFDYPVYLIWNAPQLLLFFFFLYFSTYKVKAKFFLTFLLIVLLFTYEFIPLEKGKFLYLNSINFLLTALIISLILQFYLNIYWFVIIVFTILWSNILSFGSGSSNLIHLFLAAHYISWEGFFEITKNWSGYVLTAQLSVTLIFILFSPKKVR